MKNTILGILALLLLNACSSAAKHNLSPEEARLETPPPLKEMKAK